MGGAEQTGKIQRHDASKLVPVKPIREYGIPLCVVKSLGQAVDSPQFPRIRPICRIAVVARSITNPVWNPKESVGYVGRHREEEFYFVAVGAKDHRRDVVV